MTRQSRPARPFTGKHITLILVCFFGVVVAVNLFMARLASSTFGGVVVENSYVASQHFNRWLAEAKAEDALGWKAGLTRNGAGEARIALTDHAGQSLVGAKVTAVAEHPLGRRPNTALALHEIAPGTYAAPLEPGRWRVRVVVESRGQIWRTVGDVL